MLNPFFIQSQKQASDAAPNVSFGLGIGASAYPAFFALIENLDHSESFSTNSGPAITAFADWVPSRYFSIGLGGGFQSLNQEIKGFSFTLQDSLLYFDKVNYKLNRTNIGAVLKLYYTRKDDLELYSGLKAGLSIFKFKVDINDDALINELEKNLRFPMTTPSMQFIAFGMRYYPTPFLGIMAEVGIGAPALAQAGITFKVPYSGSKKEKV